MVTALKDIFSSIFSALFNFSLMTGKIINSWHTKTTDFMIDNGEFKSNALNS